MTRRGFLAALAVLAWPAPGGARSTSARRAFRRRYPCPGTGRRTGPCPGWIIDHIRPLKRGGADHPSNMQWQTRAEARLKDRTE